MKEKIIKIILNSSLVRSKFVIQIGRFLNMIFKKKYVEIEGRKMFCHGYDGFALSIFKTYEPEQTQIVKKHVKNGDIVVDVGAHVGYYTLLLSQLVGPSGKVYAFEPDPKNFELLKKSVEINEFKNIELIQKAVSNKTSKIKLYLGNEDRATNRIYNAKLNDTINSIQVDTVSLDEYFKNSKEKISFIKIDVEGSEEGVFQGMSSLIQNNNTIKIMSEFFPFLIEKYGSTPKKYLEFLAKHDFKIYPILENKDEIEIDIDNYLKKVTSKNKVCTNLLSLKESTS